MDEKATFVRKLFSGIPSEYDQLLRWLTLGQDGRWRRLGIDTARLSSDARVLDLATGTGVFAFDWVERQNASVIALDITPAMLHHAKSVDAKRNYALPVRFVGGRTESLPFPDDRFDAISIGLALRNLTDLGASFREMARVLKPGGRLISIDFTRPHWLIQRAYYLYLCRGLPAIGRAISPEWDDTFEYLWRSILRFHEVPHVVDTVKAAGFHKVATRSLTGGIATLISGTRT
jgi:demethylmenaquinone methyltransferase/2-methoxy-6-polyprenyl-1,4-benzoquinol methylase